MTQSTAQLPSSVQAITISKTGGPEVLEKTQVPFPTQAPDCVLIKTQYLGINFIDTYMRQGIYALPSLPAVLGTEAAGIVISLPTDPSVLENESYKKRGYQVGGKVAVIFRGSHSEYISVPWDKVYVIPQSVPTSLAAAGLISCCTAVSFATEAYNIQKGDVILVHTVAGALGLILAQYAKYRGATVIGTTSTKEKAELAKANGADHVILYREEDTVQRVLEITNGEGVHAVFDGVGKDTFDKNFGLIRRKGTIISIGSASGPVPPFVPMKLSEKNLKLCRPTVFNYMYTAEEGRFYSEQVFGLIANGTLKVKVHKEYPFTAIGIQQAHKDLVAGKTVGKLVVRVTDE